MKQIIKRKFLQIKDFIWLSESSEIYHYAGLLISKSLASWQCHDDGTQELLLITSTDLEVLTLLVSRTRSAKAAVLSRDVCCNPTTHIMNGHFVRLNCCGEELSRRVDCVVIVVREVWS